MKWVGILTDVIFLILCKYTLTTFRRSASFSETIFPKWPMCNDWSHMCVKYLFKGQDNSVDFSTIECEKVTVSISYCTLQLTVKKWPQAEIWCSIMQEYPQWSEMPIKHPVFMYISMWGLFVFRFMNIILYNRLNADVRIQLSSF